MYREHVSLLSHGQLAPHVLFHVRVLLFYAFVCGANWLIDSASSACPAVSIVIAYHSTDRSSVLTVCIYLVAVVFTSVLISSSAGQSCNWELSARLSFPRSSSGSFALWINLSCDAKLTIQTKFVFANRLLMTMMMLLGVIIVWRTWLTDACNQPASSATSPTLARHS